MSAKHRTGGAAAKYAKLTFKIAIVGLLLYYLLKQGFISMSETRKAFSHLENIIPAIIAMAGATCMGIIRWQWLLRAQGIHINWRRITQLTFVGNFFNIALPGAVSGDFVKAFYVSKEVSGQRARAFGSILFDRVAGVSALVLVSAGALMLGIESFWGTPFFSAIKVFVGISAACVISFYSYLFLVREHHDPLLKAFKLMESRIPKLGSFTRIYEGLRHYHNHRWTVIKVLAISVIIHICAAYTCLNFTYALGDHDFKPLALFTVAPLGLLVTAVPLAPAGIGTGHVAFAGFFKLLGSNNGANVFTLYMLFQLAVGAVGGMVYLRFRGHEPALPMTEDEGKSISGTEELRA